MRIQLELPEEQVQELKKLMAEAGIETYKDLFNNALTVFEWLLNEVSNGKVIAAVDEQNEKYRVLEMPALERAAKAARTKKANQPALSASHR
jgi:hypothetical protein